MADQPRWLLVGRVTSPFGILGEVRVTLASEFPEQFPKRPLFIGETKRRATVRSIRRHGHEALLRLEGVDTRDSAELLRGEELFIAAEDAAPLPPGRFFIYQLIDLSVVTDDGQDFGRIKDVLTMPANDVLVVDKGGREVLLPVISDVVQSIDLEKGHVIVHLLPGLV
ncbi:MAG: ribosome maturation factor RimM [Chloroflexi bacterium]|nr:ribosome maturation factor RimM [Chloroflexota bacterium]